QFKSRIDAKAQRDSKPHSPPGKPNVLAERQKKQDHAALDYPNTAMGNHYGLQQRVIPAGAGGYQDNRDKNHDERSPLEQGRSQVLQSMIGPEGIQKYFVNDLELEHQVDGG